MPHPRRTLLAAAAAGLAGTGDARRAPAQARWPERPVRLVVPFAPGGGSDVAGRLAAQCMAPHLGQPVVVDNRSGAGGTIGTEAVAKAAPDGYTLALLTTSSAVLNVFLYRRLGFDIRRDLAAVAEVGRSPSVVAVRRDLATDVRELRKVAARNRGLTYGSGGNGTVPHLAGTLLGSALGVEVTHVPFRGSGSALTALISGQTDVLIESVPVLLGQIQDGSVRPLLVAAEQRDPLLPAVPTAAEAGLPGFEIENSYGVFAPARTPAAVQDAVAAALRTGLAEPACSQRLRETGIHPGAADPASSGAYWRSELARWAPVVAASAVAID